jgi:nucleotide-binding universal stress UspA family protein
MVAVRHPVSKPSKKDAAKRAILQRPHKDDFHEQREHDQQQTGALRAISGSTKPTPVRRGAPKPARVASEVSRIAVVTDLSLSSRRAVDLAVELALRSSAELVVVHCVEAVVSPYPIPFTPDLGPLVAAARKALDAEVKRVREVVPAAHKKLLQGCAAERVTAFINERDVGLLVVGATDGARRKVLESVAEKVAESACVPVLVVRAKTEWLGGIAMLDDTYSAASAALARRRVPRLRRGPTRSVRRRSHAHERH